MHRSVKPTHQRSGSDDYMLMTHSPQQSPHLPRSRSPSSFDSRPHGYNIDMERAQSHSRTPGSLDQSSHLASHQMPQNLLSPFDNNQMSRRSPQPDRGSAQGFLRSPSPLSLNSQGSSTLPRNFTLFNKTGRLIPFLESFVCFLVFLCNITFDLCFDRRVSNEAEKSRKVERNRSGCVI